MAKDSGKTSPAAKGNEAAKHLKTEPNKDAKSGAKAAKAPAKK